MKSALFVAATVLALGLCAHAYLPVQNPRWVPTYDMRLSTAVYVWELSGSFMHPINATFLSQFGLVTIDWSEDKAHWANQHPMQDEEYMLKQAISIKKMNPETRVFVYRNLVKALPWFTSVRKILEDPQYAGFFLKFKPQGPYHVPKCTTQANVTKCSDFYHDQEQTPEVPSPADPNPDGACNVSCDCGDTIPCGEYLWDHRNASLTQWLLDNYITGPTSVGNPAVDGLFIDDYWCSNIMNGSCYDPVQGPSEIDAHSQVDMGLSDQDIYDIQVGWQKNMAAAQQRLLDWGGYTWTLIQGMRHAACYAITLYQGGSCNNYMASHCHPSNPNLIAPTVLGLYGTSNYDKQTAAFLLARGPFAWLGYGNSYIQWPVDEPLPDVVWNSDYGVPLEDTCRQISTGVYQRKYSKATVTLDCYAWKANFTWV